MRLPLLFSLLLSAPAVWASVPAPPSDGGIVWRDDNGDGYRQANEAGLPGVRVSDGERVVVTDGSGRYVLPAIDGRTVFVIKPAGYALHKRGDGLPDFWHNWQRVAGPRLRYGGVPVDSACCKDFALVPQHETAATLEALLFADSQTANARELDYFNRDVVKPIIGKHAARLGVTLGDVANDDLSLYPQLARTVSQLGVPWLHVPGNHDLDFDALDDASSLDTYRRYLGPDTYAWEEPQMVLIGLDDVIYDPDARPKYVGGLRESQFRFLEQYLPSVDKRRLLVIGVHIPLFQTQAGHESFRVADRKRLFALLRDFPNVLLLSGHTHNQQHYYHDARNDWLGSKPLHEYNVGAACGAFWSGVADATGIPDATMSDGTPNGYAVLGVKPDGQYTLAWHSARDEQGSRIGLHAPKLLRKGAYPAWGVYANAYMGQDDSTVEYRVDGGQWKPMSKVNQPDPRMQAENVRDDEAAALRGYDRSPEATASPHLWRGTLPTDLAEGAHAVEVRYFDRWGGEQKARTTYQLRAAMPQ